VHHARRGGTAGTWGRGGTFVVFGVFGVELFCEGFVGMGLDTECFVNGKDFKEEWKLALSIFTSDFVADERGIRGEEFREWFIRGFHQRLAGGMCSHP